jgi:O-antigen/teichoic acid export membrane protein
MSRMAWSMKPARAMRSVGLDPTTVVTVATGVASQGALVVSGVVAARLLGPQDRGHFALLTLLPVVIAIVATAGVPLAVTLQVARDPQVTRPLMRSIRGLAGLQMAALLTLHAVAVLALFGGEGRLLVAGALTLAAGPAVVVQSYSLALLQGLQAFRPFNFWRVASPFCYAAGAVVVAVAGGNLTLLVVAWLVAAWAPTTGTVRAALRATRALGREHDQVPSRRTLLGFGARGLLGSQSPLETFRPDQLVVGLALPAVDLGFYVAALAFTSLPRLVAQSVGMVVYPRVAARRSAPEQWRAVATASIRTAALVTLIALPLIVFMRPLVLLFFGDDFGAAVPLARVLLLASVAQGARRILSEGARGAGAPGAGSVAELISLAVYVPAAAALVALDGVQGATWAYVVASVVSLVALSTQLYRRAHRAGRAPEPPVTETPVPPVP